MRFLPTWSLLTFAMVCLPLQGWTQDGKVSSPPPPPGPYESANDPLVQGNKATEQNTAREPAIVIKSTEKDYPPGDFDPENPKMIERKPGQDAAPIEVKSNAERSKPGAKTSQPAAVEVEKRTYAPTSAAELPVEVKTMEQKAESPADSEDKIRVPEVPVNDGVPGSYVPEKTAEVLSTGKAEEAKTGSPDYAPEKAAAIPEEEAAKKEIVDAGKDESADMVKKTEVPKPAYAPEDAAELKQEEPAKAADKTESEPGKEQQKAPPTYAPAGTAEFSEENGKSKSSADAATAKPPELKTPEAPAPQVGDAQKPVTPAPGDYVPQPTASQAARPRAPQPGYYQQHRYRQPYWPWQQWGYGQRQPYPQWQQRPRWQHQPQWQGQGQPQWQPQPRWQQRPQWPGAGYRYPAPPNWYRRQNQWVPRPQYQPQARPQAMPQVQPQYQPNFQPGANSFQQPKPGNGG